MAVVGSGIVATLVCGGFALWGGERSVGEVSMTWLTEGRVAVSVPSSWNAQRITSGPGSARVQVVSPTDHTIAVHITQSAGMPHTGLAATAHSLRAAWQEEPEGVFVDFDPSARRAGRHAVTYREIRADRHIEWTVLVEDTVRIAIGCQSAPGREHLVRDMCDRAIESAHEIR
jgi:type VII secretion-associated protein (TIGR03931 family)